MDRLLQDALDAIHSATDRMDSAQLSRHPEGKWSAAEILEHLSITFGTTCHVLQRSLDSGKPAVSPATLYQRLATILVVSLGIFPEGRKAPAFSVPKGIGPEESLKAIRQNLAAMDEVISQCEARFGARQKVASHVVLGPLSTQQWRKFHLAHTRHHMKQIARLRALQQAESQSSS